MLLTQLLTSEICKYPKCIQFDTIKIYTENSFKIYTYLFLIILIYILYFLRLLMYNRGIKNKRSF